MDWLTAVNNTRSSLLTGLNVTTVVGVRRYFINRDKQRLEEDKDRPACASGTAGRGQGRAVTLRPAAVAGPFGHVEVASDCNDGDNDRVVTLSESTREPSKSWQSM
ncbi:hypothetical protein ABJI51_39525 [Amycolatopsis sp. NEAU-NG30]|uniref:Uncharacterized protein n=1 Tax=Amycolatopsis melonis TaxID=3156488 RepID=A0ABV0LSB3_9PSEU